MNHVVRLAALTLLALTTVLSGPAQAQPLPIGKAKIVNGTVTRDPR